ncbi:hypothetical protein BOTBODRAFT_358526 [Botryobasidium botryosum FD-172 SS1]|uniref:Xylanolytic transcriptional activator regulatory domain-containing protein n=1 Tax=Botryobasidium botryosum (strain FD-172 SS1) TaxID=930990 RepID=A0A067MH57_BOTB1|nr:hypothetical protein BOTBODRAFT_358526 [Botryobasidium botryosum FD-172 SS1]
MPSNIRDPLIDTFLKHQARYFPAQWNMARFHSTYILPPTHPQSLHPALLDALCLIGCMYGPEPLRSYEAFFYARLQRSLYDCLAKADRLLDFIRASALVALYSFQRSRRVDGQNRLAAIAHFAMACGLHRIDSYDLNPANFSLLTPPASLVELGDMIHTWWSLFYFDQFVALVLHLPCTIPLDDKIVTTMWPCAFQDYANGYAAYMSYSSLSTLYSLDQDSNARLSAYDNVYAFRAKSCAMFYRVVLLEASSKEGTNVAYDARVAICVISQLTETMVSYRQHVCPTFKMRNNEVAHDSALVLSMMLAYGASIRLLHLFADDDKSAYQQRLDTARACVKLAAETSGTNMQGLLTLSVLLPWHSSYEVLAWELIRLTESGQIAAAAEVRADLDQLMDAYITIAKHYSTMSFRNRADFQKLAKFNIHPEEFAKLP